MIEKTKVVRRFVNALSDAHGHVHLVVHYMSGTVWPRRTWQFD